MSPNISVYYYAYFSPVFLKPVRSRNWEGAKVWPIWGFLRTGNTGLAYCWNSVDIPLQLIFPFSVIPYHFNIATGTERDASTTSRVFVIVMGPNQKQTERLWLDLPADKASFAAGSLEKFEVYAADVGEIKKVEVRADVDTSRHIGKRLCTFLLLLSPGVKMSTETDLCMKITWLYLEGITKIC